MKRTPTPSPSSQVLLQPLNHPVRRELQDPTNEWKLKALLLRGEDQGRRHDRDRTIFNRMEVSSSFGMVTRRTWSKQCNVAVEITTMCVVRTSPTWVFQVITIFRNVSRRAHAREITAFRNVATATCSVNLNLEGLRTQPTTTLLLVSMVESLRNCRHVGCKFAILHGPWDNITFAKPPEEYTWEVANDAKKALRFLQKDLRHHIGRRNNAIYLDKRCESPIATIKCDEGGWVSLEWLLAYDLLWCHHHRKVAFALPRDPDARQREMQRRLQLLIDGNYINYRGGDGKLRLQFLGVRLRPPDAVPPDFNAMAPVFSNGMVHVETMREELRRDRRTARVRTEHLEQTANWIRPWAVRASAGYSVFVSAVMELDPSKFALSASMSLLGQIKGAYHATEIYNLNAIVTEGLKTGSDMMELGRTSGRLRSYFGIFPPWGSRNKLTRSRSRTVSDQRTPLVTLYVPIVDLVREGGRVTENGAVICERTVPFHMVKELWLCIPGSAPYGKFEEIEKLLDYELEDEICSEVERPLTPAADEMHCQRTLERILELLCELPDGPHDGTKAGIISQLSEYFGVDWSQTDWSRYNALYDDAVEFVILHTPPPTEAKTSRNIRFRICPWCLKSTPSCLARCTFCFSVFICLYFPWNLSTCRGKCRCSDGNSP